MVVDRLRHKYSAADGQALMAALMGTTCPPANVFELVATAVNDPSSFLRTHVARRVTVNFPELLKKLGDETPQHLEILQKCITAACNVESDHLVDKGGLPCIHALRRVGLVAPTGKTAWGLALVRTRDLAADQWELRNNPKDVPTVQGSREELCRQLVDLTHRMRGSETPADFKVHMVCRLYSVMKLTEWFNFRVEEVDGGQANVVEIETRVLFDDICRGDLKELTIQGVNAPSFAC
jgi:hypothetical protein